MARRRKKKKKLTKRKARKILRHGSVRGRKLTKRQRGFFGLVSSGRKPRRLKKKKRKRR